MCCWRCNVQRTACLCRIEPQYYLVKLLHKAEMHDVLQLSQQVLMHIQGAHRTHLCLSHIEEASAPGTLPSQSAHLAPGEPHIASNQQNGGRQPQQLLYISHKVSNMHLLTVLLVNAD